MSDVSVTSDAPATALPTSLGVAVAAPPTKDESNMATAAYVLALFTSWLGPLIIWLWKKDESPFIDHHGKELLNFQITIFFAYLACIPLMFVLIGIFILPVIILLALIFCIRGALAASRGQEYRFPFAIRLLK